MSVVFLSQYPHRIPSIPLEGKEISLSSRASRTRSKRDTAAHTVLPLLQGVVLRMGALTLQAAARPLALEPASA